MQKYIRAIVCTLLTAPCFIISSPKISIITSVYKGDTFIEGFLSNITDISNFSECELIIIAIQPREPVRTAIYQYQKIFNNITVTYLDKDPGLYAVWNQAIKNSNGRYITNANIDDRRIKDSIKKQMQLLEKEPHIDLVYGNYYISISYNSCLQPYQLITVPAFDAQLMYLNLPGPQPMWRKSLHERFGYFDETFRCSGDLEFWNRAVCQGAYFKKIPLATGVCYFHDQSLSHRNLLKKNKENQKIINLYQHLWDFSVTS